MTSLLLAQRTFWLEPPASTGAENHDLVFYVLLYTMAFFFCLVMGIMLLFVVLYRRRKGQHPEDGPTHNTPLEISWTVMPLIVVSAFFVVGLKYYVDIEVPPAGADVVDVEASQWKFKFKYPNGGESQDLYLLKDRPVVLRLTSTDVTHALYIPAFRVQRNAVPGQNTEIWFKPTLLSTKDPATDEVAAAGEQGYYHVFCTQYCGLNHAEMHSRAYVLNKEDYDKKLADAANIFVKDKKPLPYVEVGKKLYETQGCSQCHSIDGSKGTGPTWKGLYKSDVEFGVSDVPGFSMKKTDDDKKWDDYFRESILHPEVKLVQGFENKMPPQTAFSGTPYNEKKLKAIIEYIKSLGDPADYKPMPMPAADSAAPPAAVNSKSSAEPAKPPATGKADDTGKPAETAKPEDHGKPAETASPASGDRFDERPADLPVDKSSMASPPAKNQDLKKEVPK